MTDTMSRTSIPARVRRHFYLIMSLVLAGLAAFGFSHTVPHDFDPPGLPIMIEVHAVVLVTWVLLFVAQPSFIVAGSIKTHRKLGRFGTALSVAVVAMGAYAIMFALYADAVPPYYPRGLFLLRGLSVLVLFSGLVIAGIVKRRNAEWHKRLMLCAAIIIIDPGLERAVPVALVGSGWPFVVDGITAVLALAGPVRDKIISGRVHPAYLWGVSSIMAGQLVADFLAPSMLAYTALKALETH